MPSRIAPDRDAIAKAAVRCFSRFGVARTNMEDVAKQSGWSRQTVYRFFPSREILLEYVAEQRLIALGEKLRPYFQEDRSIEEALIDGSLLSLRIGRTDKLFVELLTGTDDKSVEQLMFHGSERIQRLMLTLWAPILDLARESGELREDINNEMAVSWISGIHMMLTMRSAGDVSDREVLSTFLVPSLLKDQRRGLVMKVSERLREQAPTVTSGAGLRSGSREKAKRGKRT